MLKKSRTLVLSSIILALLVPGIFSSLPVPVLHHNSGSIPAQIQSFGLTGADFTFSPLTPVTGQWVNFTATPPSNGIPPYHYSWDFNDSTTLGANITVVHKFSGPGVRYVVLTVNDNATPIQNSENVVHTVPITLLDFSFSPATPLSGQAVQFTSTTPSNGTAPFGTAPFTYSWDFGDTSVGTGQTPSHTFSAPCSAPRTFNVTLTVTDSSVPSKTFTRSHLVTVTSIDLSITPLSPTSSYDFFSHDQGYIFAASDIGCSSPITYKWDFGDGVSGSNVTAATSVTIHHSYNIGFKTTAFTIKLNVTDSAAPSPNKVIVSNSLTVRGIDTQLGIDCGLGTMQAVVNGTSVPVAPSENGIPEISNGCVWIGDAGQTVSTSYDGTKEPLVSDQDETLSSLVGPGIGGGFTADIVVLQNSTGRVNGFDLQIRWNTAVLRAVEFDQTGLAFRSSILSTPIQTIDNVGGVAEFSQAISGTLSGNVTIFRIRFDVVGVGVSNLQITNINGGLANPGQVVHNTFNGSFDSERIFDPGQTLHWQANLTLPNPPAPGQPNTFRVQSSCPGCTGPFTYTWQFNSTNTTPFMVQATGNPVIVTMPNSTFSGNRVTVTITDSATPTPNVITLTMTMPLTIAIQGPTTAPVGSSSTWTAIWLGGLPSYSGTWRLCPGTQANKAVCSNPNPTLPSTQKTTSPISATYNYAGVYNNTLTLTDSSGAASTKSFQLVNVTGVPFAYTVSISANPTVPLNGTNTAFSATISYNSAYPLGSFRSSLFTYVWNFGDGTIISTPTTGNSVTMNHAYASPGNYVVRITAQEASTGTPSHIQEVGFFTVTVVSPITGSITASTTSVQTGQPISFQSTITGGTGTYTYSWDFGDSTSSTDPNPTHTYANAGTYTVKLTVTDSSGRIFNTSSQTVTITGTGGGSSNSTLIYAIVGVIIAVALIGALFMLRRRKTPTA